MLSRKSWEVWEQGYTPYMIVIDCTCEILDTWNRIWLWKLNEAVEAKRGQHWLGSHTNSSMGAVVGLGTRLSLRVRSQLPVQDLF